MAETQPMVVEMPVEAAGFDAAATPEAAVELPWTRTCPSPSRSVGRAGASTSAAPPAAYERP